MTTKTWDGGGNNNASNPKNWSPSGAPRPGDTLQITQGTINTFGNDLAGDTLVVKGPSKIFDPNAAININAHNGSVLNLDLAGPVSPDIEPRSSDQVNLHVAGLAFVNLGPSGTATDLTASGGSIHFIGGSSTRIAGGSQVFDVRLTGNATLVLASGAHTSESMELGRYVGPGLTFDISGQDGPASALQIDHPKEFFGTIELDPNAGTPASGLQYIAFMGLHATSVDIHNDLLLMYNDSKLVDVARLEGNTGNLAAEQTSAGVMLVQEGISPSISKVPGGAVTEIPLSHS